jgi:hypothetical protein
MRANLNLALEVDSRFPLLAEAPLSDDKTVAKIGHPDLDVSHPSVGLALTAII